MAINLTPYDGIGGTKISTVSTLAEESFHLEEQQTFGESGDVFDHRSWRKVFMLLAQMDAPRGSLLNLASHLFLRGKSLKIQHKSRYLRMSIPLDEVAKRSDASTKMFGAVAFISINLNMASESSKVTEKCLTVERLKCVMRSYLVPTLIEECRFPASSVVIGYADMVKSFKNYTKILGSGDEDEKKSDPDFKVWEPVMSASKEREWMNMVKLPGMVAGSISSKEVYLEDEQIFPGCIYWSGVHAMMTDASNKVKASSAPVDKKTNLEQSNFYGDFKRKMISRNILLVSSNTYYDFLNTMSQIFGKFLNTGSLMTSQESQVFDMLLEQARKSKSIESQLMSHPGEEAGNKKVKPFEISNPDEAVEDYKEYSRTFFRSDKEGED